MSRSEHTTMKTSERGDTCAHWHGIVPSVGAQFNLLPQEALA